MNFNSLIWTQLSNQNRLSNPKLIFFELVLVPEPITLESKLTIPPSHILLLDIVIYHNNFVMIFQDWSCKGNEFHNRVFHDPIHIRDCNYVHKKEVNKGP